VAGKALRSLFNFNGGAVDLRVIGGLHARCMVVK
jgi:hypothetical protein